MTDRVQISKLDAAKRQLVTAVRMYFQDEDIVSLHTLTAAAYHITTGICNSDPKLPKAFMSQFETITKPEFIPLMHKKLNETANFFKHADRDPTATHSYQPLFTEHLLFMAATQYLMLTDDNSPEIRLFSIWYRVKHPEAFDTPAEAVQMHTELFNNKLDFFTSTLVILRSGLLEH